MPIIPEQIETLATVPIGTDPDSPLFEGDTLDAIFVVAEGFQADGTAINPAPFGTDSGGWGAEVVMETGDTLTVVADTPLADDGQLVMRIALNESVGKVGKHRGQVRIFNPIAGRTRQRTIFDFVIAVTARKGAT